MEGQDVVDRSVRALDQSRIGAVLTGEADALHLLSTILLTRRPTEKTPQHEEAIAHLSDELDLREHMGAPGAIEVRCMLRRIRA